MFIKLEVVEFIVIASLTTSPFIKTTASVDKGTPAPSYRALHPVCTHNFIGFGTAQG